MLCVEGVYADLPSLALSGSPTIYKKKIPTDRNVTLPAIVCSFPPNESEFMAGGLNATEDIGYPVFLTFLIDGNQNMDLDAAFDTALLWRDTIIRHYHNKRLTGVSFVQYCKVTPRQIIDFDAFMNRNVCAGGVLIQCVGRQTRT